MLNFNKWRFGGKKKEEERGNGTHESGAERKENLVLKAGIVPDEKMVEVLPKIAEAYKGAFAGDPWYEVSKCEDDAAPQRCEGGFSPCKVGEKCLRCNKTLVSEAYDTDELQAKFSAIMGKRKHAWYTEEVPVDSAYKLALASFSWETNSKDVASTKYSGREQMEAFFNEIFPHDENFVWLDEVFADRSVRASGNLNNFKGMITSVSKKLGLPVIAYRTINEAMIRAAVKAFPNATTVHRPPEVPDHRAIIVIDLRKVTE